MYGSGLLSATALAMAAGDNLERMRSESLFAALCGASPMEASSDRTVCRRPDRGGDRRAIRALHVIAIHRIRTGLRTNAYVERRRAQKLSDLEIRRSLERFIVCDAYRLLTHTEEVPTRG